jgi:hypothetical protein
MDKKLSKFEKFLSSNIEDLINQSQDVSLFDKASITADNIDYSQIS